MFRLINNHEKILGIRTQYVLCPNVNVLLSGYVRLTEVSGDIGFQGRLG